MVVRCAILLSICLQSGSAVEDYKLLSRLRILDEVTELSSIRQVPLNDEQVDMLRRHGEVLEARRKFLARLAEGFKAGSQEIIDEAHNVLKPEYERLFQARLAWVEG